VFKFTEVFQDGNADGDFHHSRGGGLLCYDSASPEIINSTFTQNTALEGGAIACYSNSAQLSSIEARFTNCNFTDNSTELRGGTFSIYEGTVFLNSSIIEYNSAITGGDGIALDYMGKYVNISNASTVANNSSISGESDIDDDRTMIEMVPPMETIPQTVFITAIKRSRAA